MRITCIEEVSDLKDHKILRKIIYLIGKAIKHKYIRNEKGTQVQI